MASSTSPSWISKEPRAFFRTRNSTANPSLFTSQKPDEPILPPDEDDNGDTSSLREDNTPYQTSVMDDQVHADATPVKRLRYVIDDVSVTNAIERSQYLDEQGKLITEDYRVFLKDEIKKTLRRQFTSLDQFLLHWNDAERKEAIINELKQQGLPLKILAEAVPNGQELGRLRSRCPHRFRCQAFDSERAS